MAKEKKKRGLFKRNTESSTPNTPEVNSEETTPTSNDIFSEEVTEQTIESAVEQVVEKVIVKEISSEPTFAIPNKPEPTPVVKESVKKVEAKAEQEEAAQAPIVETPAPEKIENMLNLPSVPELLQSVTATSNHSDEMKLEKFIRLRKGPQPNIVHHMEMMSSGINMTKIGLLEGKVGRFKLKRSFVSEAWTITVE